ncbi:MAG: hypothetical protein IANPNBLG_01316 [Bryobacteraceae bacterium]|nr:hypothetical protein [Bryobacteraceae bacterium]
MTKVDLRYDLARPLGDGDLGAIARVHAVYGIHRVILEQPSLGAVRVEYDASRLSERAVEAALVRCGIPIVRHSPAV